MQRLGSPSLLDSGDVGASKGGSYLEHTDLLGSLLNPDRV